MKLFVAMCEYQLVLILYLVASRLIQIYTRHRLFKRITHYYIIHIHTLNIDCLRSSSHMHNTPQSRSLIMSAIRFPAKQKQLKKNL